jgi:hypothetical protein
VCPTKNVKVGWFGSISKSPEVVIELLSESTTKNNKTLRDLPKPTESGQKIIYYPNSQFPMRGKSFSAR